MIEWLRRARDSVTPPASTGPPAAGDEPRDSAAGLHDTLEGLVRLVNENAGTLPNRAVVNARHLTDVLGEIVASAAARPLDTYAVITLRSTMEDYLPTTLRRYLALDPAQRDRHPGSGRAGQHSADSPTEALLQQIDVLHTSVVATLDAVRRQDEQELMIQGSFLQTRFSSSDLDL